jgi:hypothetical protein
MLAKADMPKKTTGPMMKKETRRVTIRPGVKS